MLERLIFPQIWLGKWYFLFCVEVFVLLAIYFQNCSQIDHCTATIFCYGESGSGKSTLIRNLTKDPAAVASHTVPGTEFDTHCIFKSGLRFIDTRGFRVPLVPEGPLGFLNAEWMKEYLQWERLLRSVRSRMDSQSATDRPLAIMYCHKAGHRVIAERIKQLVSIPHQRMVPVFLVLTDVYSIDDEALMEFRQVFRGIVREVGFNPRGKSMHLLEVNSQPKLVKGRHFEPAGMPELASAILNALEPMDVLTFTHRSFLGIGAHAQSNKKRARP
jgi:GTP-binding protein EngB required for normal cell division